MDFLKGLMLGLASGSVCAVYCGPVLVPYLLSRGQNVLNNLLTIVYFMAGRLVGYLLFAAAAWAVGFAVVKNLTNQGAVFGVIYIALAILLVFYGFRSSTGDCAGGRIKFFSEKLNAKNQTVLSVILGFLTGLNLCPPFLLAFTEAARTGTLWKSILFFTAFFVGTSVYILPLAVLGLARRIEALRYVGRLAAGVVGVYYLCLGIFCIRVYFANGG
jgi:sulfite exporter TauE/SafE